MASAAGARRRRVSGPAAVAVYELVGPSERPVFVQLLPTGDQPDDIVAVPARGLLLAANQGDGTISIFSLGT